MNSTGPDTVALYRKRSCWFCDRASATDAVMGGLGSMAPILACALFGEDRMAWRLDGPPDEPPATYPAAASG